MNNILRIIGITEIENREKLYTCIEETPGSDIRLNSIVYDLLGYKFQITSLEQDGGKLCIRLKSIDQTDVHGRLLQGKNVLPNILFCSDPLDSHSVDYDYLEEYHACKELFHCARFSFEDILDRKLTLSGQKLFGITIYRGWMLKPEDYDVLYHKLKEKGIILVNSVEEYCHYHLLPEWYREYEKETIPSLWIEKGGNINMLMYDAEFMGTSFIVKDYVKSRKHEWHDACFIENIHHKEQTKAVIETFMKRQGDDLVGGVVLREYKKLKKIGYHNISHMPISEEYRVFIYAGEILAIKAYWESNSQTELKDDDIRWIKNRMADVQCSFITMDVARTEEGKLLIMEFGDGQVSGLQQLTPVDFYVQLYDKSKNHK